MTNKTIEIEAETLEEARKQIKSQIPQGLHLLSEQVISDGKPQTIRADADTTESAFTKAQSGIPSNVAILDKKELTSPAQNVVTIDALDEQSARTQLESRIGETETIKAIKLALTGKRGFLGIGKKPNQYKAQVFQQAVVEITYRVKAKISVEIGKLITIKDGYSYARDRLTSHMGLSGMTMEILDDVIGVIDQYSYGADRKVSAWDFVELTQYLSDTRSQGLSGVKMAEREMKMMRPILAGLKKLVLMRDCGVDKKEIPDDVDKILELRGPREVDEVVKYLSGVGLG